MEGVTSVTEFEKPGRTFTDSAVQSDLSSNVISVCEEMAHAYQVLMDNELASYKPGYTDFLKHLEKLDREFKLLPLDHLGLSKCLSRKYQVIETPLRLPDPP